MSRLRLRALLLLAFGVVSCSEAGIQPIDESKSNAVDDLLQIQGEVCTSAPDEVNFPVKILFIVDCSGSMQFTDPSSANTITTATAAGREDQGALAQDLCNKTCTDPIASGGAGMPADYCAGLCYSQQPVGRQAAVRRIIDRFKNNPVVEFAIIRFNGRVTINGGTTTQGFFRPSDPTVVNAALNSIAQAEVMTDYQGALAAAHQLLLEDMTKTGAAVRARTKYVVIFVSDGAPNPTCQEGCGNDQTPIAGIVQDNWCDVPRDQWCERYRYTDDWCKDLSKWYPSMIEPCRAYNDTQTILQKIADIMQLGKDFSVGEIRFHTAFLYVEGLPAAIQDLVGANCSKTPTDCHAPDLHDTCPAGELLCAMAAAGDGQFRAFASGQQIDFLSINYSSVARPPGMTNFIVHNPHAIPHINKLLTDSDADGLDDDLEFTVKSKDRKADSDDDGYGDKLEYDRRNAGFDLLDPLKPVKLCLTADKVDEDGDGLTNCEERILGTNRTLADSDRDRIPDGLEFVFGTDPLKDDMKLDVDFDGILSGEEIRIHSSPVLADPDIRGTYRYIYDVNELPERPDWRRCYSFDVRRVRLVTTKETAGAGTQGYNEILVYFGEGPADDPSDFGKWRAACVRADYVAPSYKNPATGKVTLTDENFKELSVLQNARANFRNNRALTDPCVGATLP